MITSYAYRSEEFIIDLLAFRQHEVNEVKSLHKGLCSYEYNIINNAWWYVNDR